MMPVVPALRISRPHSNTAVLLWTGGENIRFFAAAGWPVFHKTSAVRAEQQETMQAVSGQFSSGHRKTTMYAPATKAVEAPVLPTISGKMYCGNWCWSASVRLIPISGRTWRGFRKNGCNAAAPIRNATSVKIGSEWSRPRNGWLTWMFFCPDFMRTLSWVI